MSNMYTKSKNLIRFEFWAVTTLFVFFLFFWVTENLAGANEYFTYYKTRFDDAGLDFDYHLDLFLPTLLDYLSWFAAFWVANFYLVPRIIRKESVIKNLVLLGLIGIGIAAIDLASDRLRMAYLYVNNENDWTITLDIFRPVAMETVQFGILLGIYTLLKYTILYFINVNRRTVKRERTAQRNTTEALVIWLMSMFILVIAEAEEGILVAWGFIGPVGIMLYFYASNTLIPTAMKKKRPWLWYMLRVLLVMAIIFFPLFLFAALTIHDEDLAVALVLFNITIQLFITAPLSWILYVRYQKGREERIELEKELTQSTANLDFLRSQINPHFLFNALNTIYGTALEEKAERTSEGIEKLSDMMRFMLQENMQERIPLGREITYLKNYIDLQKLRTDPHAKVQIKTSIQDGDMPYQVAPMLLIPFVENAFKHGISFRELSRITVSLEIKDKTLYFDVYNTIHSGSENDPEKYKSGIGLVNVQQRLELLYPGKHELTIRETKQEYFVHLTLQLA